jgi:mannan endo-1,4-beta-mannosidase
MRRITTFAVTVVAGAAVVSLATGVGPASAHVAATPAARPAASASATPADVLAYLRGIEGNHTVSGQHNAEPNTTPAQYTDYVDATTGVYPGIWGGDFLYESDSIAARQTMINEAKSEWAAGSLVTLMWHECPPTMSEPCGWSDVESKLTSTQWSQLVTNGSALNNAWKAELDIIVPYLQQLKSAGIPVLWRPLHEINDAWSWWGGNADSAKLFQITHDYLVNTEGLTNLIWVWSVKDDSTSNLSTYYPGDQYVDVVGLDPWNSSWPSTQWYQAIQSLAGSKPMALAEVGTLPTPAQLSSQPDWTYFNDWADYIHTNNTNATIKATYYDSQVLHRGDINLTSSGGGSGSNASGPITGYGGLCVDDRASSTTNLNPVQVYTCDGGTAQHWTVESNGTLQVLGKCMDVDASGTADGTTVDLYDCNGTAAQVWQPQSDGALLNPQSGKCLDDTGWSTTAGTQLQIWDCTGNANQVWQLP